MATLDIRWPLGSIFTLVGMILLAYGSVSASAVPAAGIDVVWGGVLLLFGAAMLLLARRAAVALRHHD